MSKKVISMILASVMILATFSFVHAEPTTNVFVLGNNQYVIDEQKADVTGNGYKDTVYLIGEKTSSSSTYIKNMMLKILVGGNTNRVIEVGLDNLSGYDGKLFLGDFTGDKIADIMASAATGGSGGIIENRIATINSYYTGKLIFNSKNNLGLNFKGRFIDGFKADLKEVNYDIGMTVDLFAFKDEYIKDKIYNEYGKVLKDVEPWTDPYSKLEPVDYDGDGVYELQGYQSISGVYHANRISNVESTWKYGNGKWNLVRAQYSTFMVIDGSKPKEEWGLTYVDREGGFEIDLPYIWEDNYEAKKLRIPGYGAEYGVSLMFSPEGIREVDKEPIHTFYVFKEDVWKNLSSQYRPKNAFEIVRKDGLVYVVTIPYENPYGINTEYGKLYHEMYMGLQTIKDNFTVIRREPIDDDDDHYDDDDDDRYHKGTLFIDKGANFKLQLPDYWEGNYRVEIDKNPKDLKIKYRVRFLFSPEGKKSSNETLIEFYVMNRNHWNRASKSALKANVILESKNWVYAASQPFSNPYTRGTDEYKLFEKMISSVNTVDEIKEFFSIIK